MQYTHIVIAFGFVSLFTAFIACFTGLYTYKLLPKEMRILLFFIAISLVMGISSYFLAKFRGTNIWIIHISTLSEYTLLAYIFSYWQKSNLVKKGLRLSVPIYILIWIVSKFVLEDFSSFDNYTSSLTSAILAIISAYTLFGMLNEDFDPLYREPRFWVAIAVLTYYTGNLVTFALSASIMWTIHNLLAIFSNVCFTGGFLCLRRR